MENEKWTKEQLKTQGERMRSDAELLNHGAEYNQNEKTNGAELVAGFDLYGSTNNAENPIVKELLEHKEGFLVSEIEASYQNYPDYSAFKDSTEFSIVKSYLAEKVQKLRIKDPFSGWEQVKITKERRRDTPSKYLIEPLVFDNYKFNTGVGFRDTRLKVENLTDYYESGDNFFALEDGKSYGFLTRDAGTDHLELRILNNAEHTQLTRLLTELRDRSNFEEIQRGGGLGGWVEVRGSKKILEVAGIFNSAQIVTGLIKKKDADLFYAKASEKIPGLVNEAREWKQEVDEAERKKKEEQDKKDEDERKILEKIEKELEEKRKGEERDNEIYNMSE